MPERKDISSVFWEVIIAAHQFGIDTENRNKFEREPFCNQRQVVLGIKQCQKCGEIASLCLHFSLPLRSLAMNQPIEMHPEITYTSEHQQHSSLAMTAPNTAFLQFISFLFKASESYCRKCKLSTNLVL